ncbi:hypothetical protein [Zoogloea sp.]|uniref:hypothetical protein n=1 Tax=Zoogloea sp. TaxID=49181 RepID=UPI0025CCD333|nr:hypothetical protein [Zoogloea sp.]MCK6396053.1 hypothetical protein [Zoogloea sp.]
MQSLPAPLAAHPPIVKLCGFCSHWKPHAPESSAHPRGDAALEAQGLRPCAIGGQSWRYLSAGHRCHITGV